MKIQQEIQNKLNSLEGSWTNRAVMKKVYIIGSMVFDSPATKIEKFRFALLPNNSAKEIKTEKAERVEFWKWFDTIEQAEHYLETL